jgi:hypothetical protein
MDALRRILHRIGEWQAALLLSLIYVACWMPVGILSRLAADWLRRRAPARSNWWERPPRINRLDHVRDPF